MIYNCGLRLDEALSVTLNDLHLEGGQTSVTVFGKGSKVRTLAILPRTKRLLESYIETHHRKPFGQEDYLFYSRNAGPKGKSS